MCCKTIKCYWSTEQSSNVTYQKGKMLKFTWLFWVNVKYWERKKAEAIQELKKIVFLIISNATFIIEHCEALNELYDKPLTYA